MIAYELCLSTTHGWNWANRRRKYPLAEDISPSENSRRRMIGACLILGLNWKLLCATTLPPWRKIGEIWKKHQGKKLKMENRGNLKEIPGEKKRGEIWRKHQEENRKWIIAEMGFQWTCNRLWDDGLSRQMNQVDQTQTNADFPPLLP